MCPEVLTQEYLICLICRGWYKSLGPQAQEVELSGTFSAVVEMHSLTASKTIFCKTLLEYEFDAPLFLLNVFSFLSSVMCVLN